MSKILEAGECKGMTYKEIVDTKPDYVKQIRKIRNHKDPAIKNFVEYLNLINDDSDDGEELIDDNIMPFGKYQGQHYSALIMEEPRYCKWLLKQDSTLSKSNQMKTAQEGIRRTLGL